jgi:hypothetical protein
MKMSTISKLVAVFIICIVTISLWSLNHGFIAFLNAVMAIWIIAGSLSKEMVEKNPNPPISGFTLAAAISVLFLIFNHTDTETIEREKKALEEKAKVERKALEEKAKVARIAAMTPEERKQYEFENTRAKFGFILMKQLSDSAFDPDALKLDGPTYYSNGVCVNANGKNRFGGYVGWQKHCYIYNKKTDKWKYQGP